MKQVVVVHEYTHSLKSHLIVTVAYDLTSNIFKDAFESLLRLFGKIWDGEFYFDLNLAHALSFNQNLPVLVLGKRLEEDTYELRELFAKSPAPIIAHLLDETLVAKVTFESIQAVSKNDICHNFEASMPIG